jgi:hypothetical protein
MWEHYNVMTQRPMPSASGHGVMTLQVKVAMFAKYAKYAKYAKATERWS